MEISIFKNVESTFEGKQLVQGDKFVNAVGNVASEEFNHVSSAWLKNCKPILQIMSEVEADALLKRDETVSEDKVRLEDNLKLMGYPMTHNGLLTLNSFTEIPNAMLEYLVSKNYLADYAGYANYELDKRMESSRNSKNFLLRFREINNDDHVRGVMSERYGIIDNLDVMNYILQSLPGGRDDARCSTYWTDGDSMNGNLILPDYIKAQEDSEYGVGFTFGNSEIKTKTFSIKPYLFRAIDNTGYIWAKRDMTVGLNMKHFGKMDFEVNKNIVEKAIQTALTQGENLIGVLNLAKNIAINNPLRVIAALTRDYKMTIAQGKNWHKAYCNSDYSGSAFAIVNALSAASRNYDGATREFMELSATRMLTNSLTETQNAIQRRWDNIQSKAELLDPRVVAQYESTNL